MSVAPRQDALKPFTVFRAQQLRRKPTQAATIAARYRVAHFEQRAGVHAEVGQAQRDQQRREACVRGHLAAEADGLTVLLPAAHGGGEQL